MKGTLATLLVLSTVLWVALSNGTAGGVEHHPATAERTAR